MKRKFIFITVLSVLLLSLCTLNVSADFGGFSDDDYGGDYGGWDNDNDNYRSYDDNSNDSSHSINIKSDDVWMLFIPVAVVASIVIFGIVMANKQNNQSHPSLFPINSYKNLDEDFSIKDMCEQISALYVRMQECWTARDIRELRPYFTDALFSHFDSQLKQLIKMERINYVEDIEVYSVRLIGFRKENGYDVITASVRAGITDFTVNEHTGALVSGSQCTSITMTYEWELRRISGTYTQSKDIFASRYYDNGKMWKICGMRGISKSTHQR